MSLQEAAARLDVHYMTVYRYVRLGLLPARKVGGTWRVPAEAVEAFHAGREPAGGAPARRRGEAPWAERLEARMLAGDGTGAWSLVESALISGLEPADVYADMLAPALSSIGRRWEAGELGVGDEHIASAVANRIIGRLTSRFARPGRSRGTVVALMPPGERHGFGIAMLADVLRGAGYEVVDLGPDTPVASAAEVVGRSGPLAGICIAVVYSAALPAAAELVAAVRLAAGPGVPVVVGGHAVGGPEEARRLGADRWTARLTDVVALLAGSEE